jgi:hypothetical protein
VQAFSPECSTTDYVSALYLGAALLFCEPLNNVGLKVLTQSTPITHLQIDARSASIASVEASSFSHVFVNNGEADVIREL